MEQQQIWNLIAKKLSGEASELEISELQALLRKYPDLHYPIQTITDLWNPGQDIIPHEEALNAYDKHLLRLKQYTTDFESPLSTSQYNDDDKEINPTDKIQQRKKIALGAFVLAVIFIAGLLFEKFFVQAESLNHLSASVGQKNNSEISTKNGSRTNVILPDGTQVWVNAGSKLSYDKNYGNTIREVNLTGEAFFDVVKNAEKPFIIHTSKIDIKVLGTRFNVKSYPNDKTTEASLIRGSIEVSFKDRPTEKIILKPNEKIVVANNNEIQSNTPGMKHENKGADGGESIVSVRNLSHEEKTGAILETSWVENKLIFQDEAFTDLAKRMERWYGVTIHFEDQAKEGLRFTGTFENETIQQALEALKLTTGKPSMEFDYTINGTQVAISK